MRFIKFILLFLVMGLVVGENYITMTYPETREIHEGDIINVGVLGPGQTIPVRFSATTTRGGRFGDGGRWDQIVILSAPRGWKGFDSKLYEDPLQINVKADPMAAEGDYSVRVMAVDDGNADRMGNLTFTLVFTVKHDIYDFSVEPEHVSVGAYQPARFRITIFNKGNAPDMFVISSEGLEDWVFQKTVYVPERDYRTVVYEVVGKEEEDYPITIKIRSMNSPLIHDSKNVSVSVRSDLKSDYHAVNNGLLLFPTTESPIYAFIGILSNLLR